jgi:hypothetical protein
MRQNLMQNKFLFGFTSCFILLFILLFQNLYSAEKTPAIAIDYITLLRGQAITEKDVPSHEINHILKFKYIPAPYLSFSISAGMQKFSVDAYNSTKYDGNFGFAPGAGFGLTSPGLLDDRIWVIAGADFEYLNSKEESGYAYEGPMVDVFGGARFALAKNVELEAGGRTHFIDGAIRNTKTLKEYGAFSNRNIVRGYGALILKSMEERVNFSVYFDASPEFSKEWENGPLESSLGFSIGFLIVPDTKAKKLQEKSKALFPAFEKNKKRIEDMEQKMEEDN